MSDIKHAYDAYLELAAKYQEEDLDRTADLDDEDNLDIKVFRNLVNQVAFETMEQFQTKFNHISQNSHFSARFTRLSDLYQPKNTLLNEDHFDDED